MVQFLTLLWLALTLTPASGLAFGYYFPQGQREALMGNVGIALSDSEGSVLYNPAGAAGLNADRISASGSLLNASIYKIENSGVVDRSTSPSYTQIPGLIAGYHKTTWGQLGFFINTDIHFNFNKFLTMDNSEFGQYYSEFELRYNSLNLGLIYATSQDLTPSTTLQYGFTARLNLVEAQQNAFIKTYAQASDTYIGKFNNTVVNTTNFVGRLGVLLNSDTYSLGAFYQPKGSILNSSYSQFSYEVSTGGTVQDDSTNSGPAVETPTSYGFGFSFKLLKRTRLYLDSNIFEASTPDNSDANLKIIQFRIASYGVGVEHTLASGNNLYGGLHYAEEGSASKPKTWLFSTGFDYKINFIRNYLGAYYSQYESKAENTNVSSSIMSFIGVIIASQYTF